MNILVVNDDGIEAEGIHILAHHLKKYGEVTVCAPNQGRSAASHSIVLNGSIGFDFAGRRDDINWYQTDGMPADCVRLAVDLLETSFDLIFSGVNNRLNLGTDVIYSGTVAAAREGIIEGIPAIAISTDDDAFEIVRKELEQVLDFVFQESLYSKNYVLNINFPTKEYEESIGYRFCRQGIKAFKTSFKKNEQGKYVNFDNEILYDTREDTDVFLASKGYITFVPLQLDQTSEDDVYALNKKDLSHY